MSDTFTAVTKKDGDWWIGWIEEVPGVNCQERTREQLLESLRVTLAEAIEMPLRCKDLGIPGIKDVSIISDNCWGGFVSRHFGLPYRSPFVGLFLFAEDYLRLLEGLPRYLGAELSFIEPVCSRYREQLKSFGTLGKYPVGVLDDVEVHFLHYKSAKEARGKWARRLARVDFGRLLVKFSDQGAGDAGLAERFDNLGYSNKICLTNKDYGLSSCIRLEGPCGGSATDEWKSFLATADPADVLNRVLAGPEDGGRQ